MMLMRAKVWQKGMCIYTPVVKHSRKKKREKLMITHEEVKKLFSYLETNNSEAFFARVSDDVFWTVMGTHPLAGKYKSKKDFFDATFLRLNNILQEGVILKVNHIYIDNMTAIVEMESLSTANNGNPFNNTYCWVTEFNEKKVIKSVRAYVDSALVEKVIQDNE